jgi:S1-C subfamily serine protease
VDGVSVSRSQALRWRVSNKGAGRSVRLRVLREGRSKYVTLHLEDQPSLAQDAPPDMGISPSTPAAPAHNERPESAPPRHHRSTIEATRLEIGAVVTDVDEVARVDAGLAAPIGALVESVEPSSVGQAAGLSSGDVVLKVNRTEIATRDDLVAALANVAPGEWVRLFVRRSQETHALSFRKPLQK